jgi:hypothetical protein
MSPELVALGQDALSEVAKGGFRRRGIAHSPSPGGPSLPLAPPCPT